VRKILRLDIFSAARLFAILYALGGLYNSVKSVWAGDDFVSCPFGIWYPMWFFTVNLNIKIPHPASWLTPLVVLCPVAFYAVTGVISGVVLVILYNLTSKFWPGILGRVEANERPAKQA
jgi:hypothetical protein